MHVLIALLFGLQIWLVAIVAALLSGRSVLSVFLYGPVIVSGSVAFILAIDHVVTRKRPDETVVAKADQ